VLDADHQTARRFVVEGDATFTMFLFALDSFGKGNTPGLVKMLRAQLDQFATMSPDDMLHQNVLGISAGLDPELQTSLSDFGSIPSTVLVPIIDSYLRGSQLVATAYERGGWPAVDALYTEPPESTEQVLHPATKLYPNREHPAIVTIAPAHDPQIASLVFGELQWQVYFQLWAPTQKAIASEGWGGDRAIVARRPDGRLLARIATTWDTPKDAGEMRTAYVASLAARFPKGTGDPTVAAGFDRGDGAGKIYLAQRGSDVFIVDGADDRAVLDDLVASTQIQRDQRVR